MDWGIINQIINWGVNWLLRTIGSFSSTQWMLLVFGVVITVVAVYYAWKASRPAAYKLAVFGAKIGLTMVVLAFAWPYAVEVYRAAISYTGNHVISALAVLAGGFLGYRVIMMLFRRKKEVM